MGDPVNWRDSTPLGRSVDYDRGYDANLLVPIPRSEGREALGLHGPLPFTGWDVWNAWEVSWLGAGGKPTMVRGEFRVPADSPRIIESKSLKVYLNSLNQERAGTLEEVQSLLARDLSDASGAPVVVRLLPPDAWPTITTAPRGQCLDGLPIEVRHYHPEPSLLRLAGEREVVEALHTLLLRTCCPITGQPDWGGLEIRYRGPAIDHAGLLAYVISFRQQQDFHEQCVERMFRDILAHCRPHELTLEAHYLRRGGVDINPFRTNTGETPENSRWHLQ